MPQRQQGAHEIEMKLETLIVGEREWEMSPIGQCGWTLAFYPAGVWESSESPKRWGLSGSGSLGTGLEVLQPLTPVTMPAATPSLPWWTVSLWNHNPKQSFSPLTGFQGTCSYSHEKVTTSGSSFTVSFLFRYTRLLTCMVSLSVTAYCTGL